MSKKPFLNLSNLDISLILIFLIAMGFGSLFLWNHRRTIDQHIAQQKAEQEQQIKAMQSPQGSAIVSPIRSTQSTSIPTPRASYLASKSEVNPSPSPQTQASPSPTPSSTSLISLHTVPTQPAAKSTQEEPKAQPQVQTTSRYYSQAIQTAQEAYKAHQGAKRLSDYSTAINMLRQAVSLLENIDSQDSNYRLAQSKIKEYQTKISEIQSQALASGEAFLLVYLEGIIDQGLRGIDFWCETERQYFTAFYSARDAQILRYGDQGNEFFSGVRIASSTREGQPIIQTWTIVGMKGQAITPNPKYYGWCISFIYEE